MENGKDFLNYLKEIFDAEHSMPAKIRELMAMTQDEGTLSVCKEILKEKTRHDTYVKTLLGLGEGILAKNNDLYNFSRNLLDSLIPQINGGEKRRYVREPYLGEVKLRDMTTWLEYKARCMDISEAGLGIEISKEIPSDVLYELSIDLYGRPMSINQFGRIVWMKQLAPDVLIAGIEYQKKQ